MIDKKELISTYLQQFGSHYQISRLLNPTLRIDDEFISHFFEQVVDQYGETFAITEEEKTEIERKIKSQYCIFQDEGAALVGDYEHDFMWYANLQAQEDYDEYYWPRYKAHLENKNFSPAGIDTLENKTLPKLMSYIGNPNEDSPFSIRGLVVGDVQSGKTSNYLGLITKAADAGYKVIFLLTGTIESLRRQTQKRVEEGFIGYDSVNAEDVGVGRGSRTPKAFTSRNNDFTGKNDQNTTYKINDNASEPMIFVIKKNVSVLKKLYASLKNINTSSAVSQITVPMIMIDDEADNASINTNKKDEDPTKINNYIRKILTLFARNTYVGFTATPFANVFISYDTQDEMLADDLFPRHFIYSLESPSNYCGAQKYFFESNSNVRFINDYDDKVFPLRHKKEWDGDKLFPSFYHSINVFLLANAIRDIREVEKNTHRSMLINMSRFTDVQFVIKEIVENYFADMKRAIKQNCRCKKEDYMRNSLISALYESYELEYADNNWFGKTATWDQVFERLPEAIKDIEIAVVNSSRNSNKLDYSKHERDGLRVIAIGGLALSRGLTLEGLCVTYDEYIAAQPVRGRNLLSAFPYKIEVEDKDGNAANIDFAISGWMGTVRNLPDLRLLEKETDDAEDEDRITINDNRISLYSRGKLGEYDILSKIKNNRNSEAYVIGELYVDIFEQDGLADMAISNRRGYEENDPRYIEVIKIAKRLLGYIVGQKDIVSKRRKEDDQRIEDEKIKKKFWENPQTREILELRLNDAEKQVVQEENLQFTRAVNNGKQTKKIFISHKEEHKLYGQFIVDVLETYGVDVVSTIIFTGDRRLGVPQGKDIYDYLKDCFREDLMVIFLFSKAFYDSNICISEAGAAWATNQNCMNVVIDISFSDIEKPSNNALSSIKFQQIRTPDQTITVTEFFKTIIEEGLHFEYDESKLQKALNYVLKTDKYSDQKIDFPATFLPKRKFLPVPRCPKCHNIMLLTEENGRLKYVCSNVSCDECYEAVIN